MSMQAVILAAGKSTRAYPLTLTRPKVLLPLLNSTILEHNLDQLDGLVKEAIIVVGFNKEMIMQKVGKNYKGISINYVEQKEQKGTGHALLTCEKLIKGPVLVFGGDDLHSGADMRRLMTHQNAALTKKVPDPERFGVFVAKGSKAVKIIEKPKEFVSDLANTGCYVFEKSVFSLLRKLRPTERGELELTDAIAELIKSSLFEVEAVTDYWLAVSYPWNVLEANVFILHRITHFESKGTIESGATVNGNLRLGKGSIVKSGSYIEGPVWIGENCVIGPQAYLRPDSIILDNCHVRSEVFDALIMNDTTAKHQSYIAHSVVGEDCNIAIGTVTADYRHDGKNNMTLINGRKIATGRRKLGAFIGDRVKTGVNTIIYPGRKIWPGMTTLPGEIVSKDIVAKEMVSKGIRGGKK